MAEQTQTSPPNVTFLRFILKLASGVGAGITGSLVLIVVFLLTSSILQPALESATELDINPMFVFILMVMMFLASCGANIVGCVFLALTERERYTRLASSLYQIFIINIIVFALTVPMYFITARMGVGMTAYAAGIHILLSAQASAIALDMVSAPKYALLGLYSTIFAIILSTGVAFLVYSSMQNATILLFIIFPIVWISIGFMEGLVGMIYKGVYSLWGTDFLAQNVDYGDDYGKEEEKEEVVEEEKPDQEGADFLRNE